MRKVALLVVGIFAILLALAGCKSGNVDVRECSKDSDCVQAGCCHADSCVAASQAPDCSGIYCSMECAPGTLDCGQGSCACLDGKCGAVFE